MHKKLASIVGGAALAFILATAGVAAEQPLSSGIVTLLVPFSPGGSLDIVARLLADNLSRKWGSQVIIQNKPGASGILASRQVVGAAPDGHTLIIVSPAHALNPLLLKEVPYDTFSDFTPIAKVSEQGNLLLASKESSYNSLADVVKASKSGGQPVQYGMTGMGTSVHLSGVLLGALTGGKFEPVQYKGGSDVIVALLGNHLDFGVSTIVGAARQVMDGAIRALAITSTKRNPALPNVPTVIEAGVKDYELVNWWGVLGPKGMDPALVNFINAGIRDALTNEDSVRRLAEVGIVPDIGTPQQFDALIRAENKKWQPILEAAGIEKQ